MTFAQLASRSLRVLGAIDPDETLTPNQLSGAMEACNAMLKSWATRGVMVNSTTQTSYALPKSTVSVTIGSGGDIDIARPSLVSSVTLTVDGSTYVLEEETVEEYNAWGYKTESSVPEKYAVRKDYPLMTMYFRDLPDQNYTLKIETQQPFVEFTSVAQTVLLPGEYEEPIVFNLAIRLAPEYQRQVSQEVVMLAASSMQSLKNINASPINKAKLPFLTRRSSIYEGYRYN